MINIQNNIGDNAHSDILTDDSRLKVIGLIIIVVTFVCFGGWAFLAPLGGAVLAPGVVVVKSHRKTVQHLEGGIINRLRVDEGDIVEAGQTLLELDDTLSSAELGIARSQYVSAQTEEARLLAERDGLNDIVYPVALSDSKEPRINKAMAVQNGIFLARLAALTGEKRVLEQQIDHLKSQILGMAELSKSKQILVDSFAVDIRDTEALIEDGFADNIRLREFQRSHAQNQGDIADLKSRVAGSKINIGETRLRILQLEKQRQEEVTTRLGEVRSLMFELEDRMAALSDKVRRVGIIAPVGGMVIDLAVHTEGGVVTAGQPLMDIVPVEENLIIEAQVMPLDIDRIKVGMEAEVRFSLFKTGVTPVLHGVVKTLSADRLINDKTDMAYYLAQVELTTQSWEDLSELELMPGMPAEVLITTAERTLFRYFSQPITDMLAQAFIEE